MQDHPNADGEDEAPTDDERSPAHLPPEVTDGFEVN